MTSIQILAAGTHSSEGNKCIAKRVPRNEKTRVGRPEIVLHSQRMPKKHQRAVACRNLLYMLIHTVKTHTSLHKNVFLLVLPP